MKRLVRFLTICLATMAGAQEFNRIPLYGWIGDHSVAFTYDLNWSSVTEDDFVLDAATGKRSEGVLVPSKRFSRVISSLPFQVDGAENLTYSPDSTKMAFTRDNDLWVVDVATKKETRLTTDGSDVILNGYSSWVYYEEILGRPTRYKAFWWSPDSKKIGFYRFDNTEVPFFPIYSAVAVDADRSGLQLGYGQNAGGAVDLEDMSPTGGSVRMTRYPK
ncbi:MAG: DPP IV N-terminal domain-containing protein, partial [Bacteroidales bacterium]|nr:DPP IV N-terminal domain-containing protein [Bacteroidales bacterium]